MKVLICPYCMKQKELPDFEGCCHETSAHYVYVPVDEDDESLEDL